MAGDKNELMDGFEDIVLRKLITLENDIARLKKNRALNLSMREKSTRIERSSRAYSGNLNRTITPRIIETDVSARCS